MRRRPTLRYSHFMNRTTMLTGAAAAMGALSAPRGARAQTNRTIGIATLAASAANWPSLVCEELGFYKRYNLDIQSSLVNSIASAAQQIVAGACDMTGLSTTQYIETVTAGASLKFFCNQVTTPPYSLIAQKQYKKYADLRGTTIIIGGVNDITHIFIDKMMASGGVKPDQFDLIYAGATPDRYSALRSGSVAAALLFPPFDFRAVDEGYNNVGSLPDVMPPFPFTGWTVRTDFLAKNPGLVLDFTKAYLRGTRWVNDPANRERAIGLLLSRTNVSRSDAQRSYDLLVGKYRIFPSDGVTTDRSISVVIDALVSLKVLKPPVPAPGSFYDNSIVRRAVVELARE
jgi:ABC-type nitrate/sulfonate/bicarbonate transport system substrate-binding protein